MNQESTLAGERILVVEDDFLLAWDTKSALTRAGATVVGPVAEEAEAAEMIREGEVTAALTDLNLGKGPSFKTANALRLAGIPFAFLTGYDDTLIPDEFKDVPRFRKPIDMGRLARELSRIFQAARS